MKKNFTEKATWACLVIAPATQVCFDFCLLRGGIIDVQKGKIREDRILATASDTKNIFINLLRYLSLKTWLKARTSVRILCYRKS